MPTAQPQTSPGTSLFGGSATPQSSGTTANQPSESNNSSPEPQFATYSYNPSTGTWNVPSSPSSSSNSDATNAFSTSSSIVLGGGGSGSGNSGGGSPSSSSSAPPLQTLTAGNVPNNAQTVSSAAQANAQYVDPQGNVTYYNVPAPTPSFTVNGTTYSGAQAVSYAQNQGITQQLLAQNPGLTLGGLESELSGYASPTNPVETYSFGLAGPGGAPVSFNSSGNAYSSIDGVPVQVQPQINETPSGLQVNVGVPKQTVNIAGQPYDVSTQTIQMGQNIPGTNTYAAQPEQEVNLSSSEQAQTPTFSGPGFYLIQPTGGKPQYTQLLTQGSLDSALANGGSYLYTGQSYDPNISTFIQSGKQAMIMPSGGSGITAGMQPMGGPALATTITTPEQAIQLANFLTSLPQLKTSQQVKAPGADYPAFGTSATFSRGVNNTIAVTYGGQTYPTSIPAPAGWTGQPGDNLNVLAQQAAANQAYGLYSQSAPSSTSTTTIPATSTTTVQPTAVSTTSAAGQALANTLTPAAVTHLLALGVPISALETALGELAPGTALTVNSGHPYTVYYYDKNGGLQTSSSSGYNLQQEQQAALASFESTLTNEQRAALASQPSGSPFSLSNSQYGKPTALDQTQISLQSGSQVGNTNSSVGIGPQPLHSGNQQIGTTTANRTNTTSLSPLSLGYLEQYINALPNQIYNSYVSPLNNATSQQFQKALQYRIINQGLVYQGKISPQTATALNTLNMLLIPGTELQRIIQETPVLGNLVNFIYGQPEIQAGLAPGATPQQQAIAFIASLQAIPEGYLAGRTGLGGIGAGAVLGFAGDPTLQNAIAYFTGKPYLTPQQAAQASLQGGSSWATYAAELGGLSKVWPELPQAFGSLSKPLNQISRGLIKTNPFESLPEGLGSPTGALSTVPKTIGDFSKAFARTAPLEGLPEILPSSRGILADVQLQNAIKSIFNKDLAKLPWYLRYPGQSAASAATNTGFVNIASLASGQGLATRQQDITNAAFGAALPFVFEGLKSSPIQLGSVKTAIKPELSAQKPLGKLKPVNEYISNDPIIRKKAYIGGSGAAVLQLPEGTFRQEQDLELYVPLLTDIKTVADRALREFKKFNAANGISNKDVETDVVEKGNNAVQIRILKGDTPAIDVVYRSPNPSAESELVPTFGRSKEPDQIKIINGIKVRDVSQILADKEEILKDNPNLTVLKLQKIIREQQLNSAITKLEKAEYNVLGLTQEDINELAYKPVELKARIDKTIKARGDTPMIKNALADLEEQLTNYLDMIQQTVLRGVYLKTGEGKAFPLVGYSRPGEGLLKTGIQIGNPDLPILQNREFPLYGAGGNIASYPATAYETAVLTSPKSLERVGLSENDIQKVQSVKLMLNILKNQKSKFLGEFPKMTKVMDEQQTGRVIKLLQGQLKDKIDMVKLYGSFAEGAQRKPELQRDIGDIEIQSANKGLALSNGQKLVRAIGAGAKVVDEGIGTLTGKMHLDVNGEKAIELKYPGDGSEIEGSAGYRYGYAEDRPTIKLNKVNAVQTAYEQLVRKAGASATFFKDESGKNIVDAIRHRPKDVVDTYAIGTTLADSLRIKAQQRVNPLTPYGALNSLTPVGAIKSMIEAANADKADAQLAKWRNLEWKNPEVTEQFAELDANRLAYLQKMGVDVTSLIKSIEDPSPKVTMKIGGTINKIVTFDASKPGSPTLIISPANEFLFTSPIESLQNRSSRSGSSLSSPESASVSNSSSKSSSSSPSNTASNSSSPSESSSSSSPSSSSSSNSSSSSGSSSSSSSSASDYKKPLVYYYPGNSWFMHMIEPSSTYVATENTQYSPSVAASLFPGLQSIGTTDTGSPLLGIDVRNPVENGAQSTSEPATSTSMAPFDAPGMGVPTPNELALEQELENLQLQEYGIQPTAAAQPASPQKLSGMSLSATPESMSLAATPQPMGNSQLAYQNTPQYAQELQQALMGVYGQNLQADAQRNALGAMYANEFLQNLGGNMGYQDLQNLMLKSLKFADAPYYAQSGPSESMADVPAAYLDVSPAAQAAKKQNQNIALA